MLATLSQDWAHRPTVRECPIIQLQGNEVSQYPRKTGDPCVTTDTAGEGTSAGGSGSDTEETLVPADLGSEQQDVKFW